MHDAGACEVDDAREDDLVLYGGDVGEMWGRCGRDMGEIQGDGAREEALSGGVRVGLRFGLGLTPGVVGLTPRSQGAVLV